MKNGVWFFRLGSPRPDRRLARAALRGIDAAVVTIAREAQHRGVLEPAVDARRHDPHGQSRGVQILGEQQAFQMLPDFVAHDIARDHVVSDRPGFFIPPPAHDFHLQPIRLYVHAGGDQRDALRHFRFERLAAVPKGMRIRGRLVGVFPQFARTVFRNALSVSGDFFAARNSIAISPQDFFGEINCDTRKPGMGDDGFCARYSPRSTIQAFW